MSLDWTEELPDAEAYVALRRHCRLSERSLEAARAGLPRSLHAVCLKDGDALAGFARIVGDGGCFAQLTDVMVREGYRGHGYGRALIDHCVEWARAELPESCYLGLIANARAERLYTSLGFKRDFAMGVQL